MTESPAPPIRRGYALTAAGQVHYRERSGRDPAIVLLHQTALSSRSYEPLLREVGSGHRLVAPDLPGFGQSFAPEGWPAMRQYAQWIVAALGGR
jgi:pimeloyl-ACP methyl ester carboxylesterase